jgi:hypothetical protein
VRGIENDGQDSGPSLRRCEACVLVAALGPGDAEAVARGADDARDVDRDLDLADLAEQIGDAGIVVERGN